jgi:hypothetical protein
MTAHRYVALWYRSADDAMNDRRGESRIFPKLPAAIGHLQRIADRRAAFACLRVTQQQQIERRCRFCHCGGWLDVWEYVLDDTAAIVDTSPVYFYDADGCERRA